jgi:hypothetical protein
VLGARSTLGLFRGSNCTRFLRRWRLTIRPFM